MVLRRLLILMLVVYGLPLGLTLSRAGGGAKHIGEQAAMLPVVFGDAKAPERTACDAVCAAILPDVKGTPPRAGRLRHVPDHVIAECAKRGMRTSGRHPPVNRHV